WAAIGRARVPARSASRVGAGAFLVDRAPPEQHDKRTGLHRYLFGGLRRLRVLQLDGHDQALVEVVRQAMEAALRQAHTPTAVAKRVAVLAVRQRNKGRSAAKKRHPFAGICEASGQPLAAEHADLDELDPELGYAGRVRWVCKRANNSGKHSC